MTKTGPGKFPKRGPGRPKSGRIQVALKLLPSTNEMLVRAARLSKTTKSEFAELAILERIARLKH
jgi:uncharacterized protein (DUF1778 family)